MSSIEKLHVQIGQVKVAGAGQSLEAILGSCIGIGFLCPSKGKYGLAHALLAKSTGPAQTKDSGRHVDHAIQSLMSMLEIGQDERREVRVFLAGGANMTMPPGSDPSRLVGTVNANFARKALREAKLRVIEDETGGDNGRRVTIDCTSGEYSIQTIPRLGGVA